MHPGALFAWIIRFARTSFKIEYGRHLLAPYVEPTSGDTPNTIRIQHLEGVSPSSGENSPNWENNLEEMIIQTIIATQTSFVMVAELIG